MNSAPLHPVEASPQADPLAAWLARVVILDTMGPFIYIGTLSEIHGHVLILTAADVHDSTDSSSTKEFYIARTRELGVHSNRDIVAVQRQHVVSISPLDAVQI